MGVTKDKIQVSIEFLTDEGKQLAKTINDTKDLHKQLRDAQKSGKDVSDILQKIADSGGSLADLDLKNVLPSQLIERAKQLKTAMAFIPEAHPARAQMERELRDINARLGEMNTRTRATAAGVQQLSKEGGGLKGIFENAFSMFLGGGVLGIVTAMIGVIADLGKTTLQTSMEMETNLISITTLLNGNEKAAKAFYDQIQKMAARTPFETKDLAEAGKQLLVFGYSTDAAIALLGRLGDVAAVTQVPITDLANIVGKAKLGELIQAEELNQLSDRGIAVFDELAKVLGVSTAEIKKLGSEGKISYKDLQKAIEMTTEKGGKFYEGMLKQSQTVSGLWSTVKDNFSLLMRTMTSGSTDFLKPFLKVVGDIIGGINEVFSTGKKATGEYGDVINYFVMVLKGLGIVFKVVWEAGKLLWESFKLQVSALSALSQKVGEFIAWGEKLPIIGSIFRGISNTIKVLGEYIDNASATTAGFGAATQAILDNMKNAWLLAVNVVKIAAKEIELAFTVDSGKRQAIQGEIANLRQWAASNAQGFKSVSEAYHNARNAAINAAQVAQTQEAALAKKREEDTKKTDPKEAAKKEKERLQRLKDALDLELKDKEIFYRKEELANEIAFLKKEKTEKEFKNRELELEAQKYNDLIKIYETYQVGFGQKSEQFRDLEIKKLEAQKKIIEANAKIVPLRNANLEGEQIGSRTAKAPTSTENNAIGTQIKMIQNLADAEKSIVRQKFADILTFEQEFEIQRLEIQKRAFERQMKLIEERQKALEAANQTDTEEYKKNADEYKNISKSKEDTDNALVDNKKRLKEVETHIEESKQEIAHQTFDLAIDLLSADEEARKKHAGAIKAFQIAEVITNGITEVQKIWANTAEFGPLQPLFAIPLTALAVGRSAVAIRNITKQKFEKGGIAALKNGIFGGASHADGGTQGYFSDGTQVEVEKDEAFVVVNKKDTSMLKMLSAINARSGKAFFAQGGLMSTQPVGFNAAFNTPSVGAKFDTKNLEDKIEILTQTVATQQTQMKAFIVYSEFETVKKTAERDSSEATY